MIIQEEMYLEHFCVKGMHWGVRNVKSAGVSVGRGAKKTFKFSKDHPKTTALISTGAAFAISLLVAKGRHKIPAPDYLDDGLARDVRGIILDPQPTRIGFH